MKIFFDTEFIESKAGIELVSIGMVSERGDTFYAESVNFDERNADDWVKENVLDKLIWWGNENSTKGFCNASNQMQEDNTWKSEVFGTDAYIRDALLAWVKNIRSDNSPSPEFYAYFADYDWVIFARLFGRMINLPKGFPFWCIDLKQMMWERGLDKAWKQTVCPDPKDEHHALADAQWNKKLHGLILRHEKQ